MPSVTQLRVVQLRPQRSLTISPEAWWSAPHRQSGTTQWSTGKGRRWRSRGQGAGWGQGKKRTPPPESPQEHSLIPSCGRILEGSKANHLQLPSSCPTLQPLPSSGTQLPSCPPEPPALRQTGSYVRVVTANHLPVGDLVTKAIGGFVGIHRHIQHIRGVDTAKGH